MTDEKEGGAGVFCNNDQDKSREQTREQRILEWYFRLNRLHRKVVEQELSTTGVYRSQHRILMCLAKNPHISQTELAERQEVSTSAIAVSLKKLQQGGYIQKELDQRDNRFNQICITEKGQKVVEESRNIFQRIEEEMFRGFSDEELKVFGDTLEQICGNLERISKGEKQESKK